MSGPTFDGLELLDGMLEGVQVLDGELRYQYVNECAALHGRTTRAALLGRTMTECYPGIEHTEVYALIEECRDHRTVHTLDNLFTFPDGTTGWFELRITPVSAGVCVLSIDVTARRTAEAARDRAEARLQGAEHLRAIGELAAGVAHDFNNLLTVILGEGELAVRRLDTERDVRPSLQTMIEAARSAAELTRQLLAYGRRSVLRITPIDVPELVRGLERMLRSSLDAPIELRIEVQADVEPVLADRTQLEQCLLNLVLNARDAIVGSGRITIDVGSAALDEDAAAAHGDVRPGRYTVLTVTDTGAGMDEATRVRIFEPFFTTKALGKGTGLGLATVYGTVRQQGGTLWVYSEVGIGTTFKLYFPVSPERARAASVPPPPPRLAAAPGGQTVLVAEDAPLVRKLIETVLTRAGYRVLLSSSGEEALARWREPDAHVALLITDVVMPGISGPALIDAVRSECPGLPVICTSGYADRELVARGSMPANVEFVAKPFSPSVLLERVRAALGQG